MIVYFLFFYFNKCAQIHATFKNIIMDYLNFKITKQFSVFDTTTGKKCYDFVLNCIS